MNVPLAALAGAAATVPMTAAMEFLHRRLPPDQQYPLPPREIINELLDAPPQVQKQAAIVGHFGYGAAGGVLYCSIQQRLPGPPALRGMLFGMGVWSASYLGWLPAAGILRPATQHPGKRTALMIASHLIWGASLGVFADGVCARMPVPAHGQSQSFIHR